MFVTLYLFLATEIFLVSANPLLQFLPQSCPICQTNCRNNPSLFQPSNINSYIPTNSVPNPLAPCQNPSDQLNQMILNKIFKNPTLRTILDPNTKLYGQNGVEIPRQPSTPNSVPNVVNNYIIIPPECIFNGTEDINAWNNVGNERRVNKNGNKNGSNARRRANVGAARKDNNIDQGRKEKVNKQNGERKSVQNQSLNNSDTEPKRERRKHRRKQERTITIENKVHENEGLNDSVQEKERENGSVDEGLNTNLEKQVSVSEPPMSDDLNHSSLKCDICKTEHIKAISNPELEEHTQDKAHKHPTPRNGNRKGDRKIGKPKDGPEGNFNPKRRNQEEALIQDFHRKYPGIPEVVIRDLLAYLKRQMQKEQLGMPNIYYPYRPFPLTYDQIFQNQFVYPQNDDSGSRKARQKSNRRSRNKKRKEQTVEPERKTTVKLAPTKETEVPTTTGSPINTAPTDAVSRSPKSTMATTLAELQRTSIADIIENTTPKSLKSKDKSKYVSGGDALGTEDVVPTMFNDYYPDFTADNQAYSKINEVYLGNPVDDRYQYTTDKNLPIEEYYRERRKYESNYKTNKEETSRTSYETETTIARPTKKFFVENSEEIHYKAPPKLEVPDFLTRNVNGDYEQNESDVYYDRDDEEYFKKYIDNTEVHKASTFSDAKTPQYNEKGKPKKVGADVETVFAKSKVVKFGYGRDYNDITAPTPIDNDNELKANEDQPTIVIAKSYPEDFWY